MHPYLTYALLPLAVLIAWYTAPDQYAQIAAPGRYEVPAVQQLDDPTALMKARAHMNQKPDIRLRAFLPIAPPPAPSPEPTLVLQSVMTGRDVAVATINGKLLRPGNRIDGYKVTSIASSGVHLVRGKEQRFIPMRALYQLPPPLLPGQDGAGVNQPGRNSKVDLNQDFWKVFDSLKL